MGKRRLVRMLADLDMRVHLLTKKYREIGFMTANAIGYGRKLERAKRTRRALRTHLNAWVCLEC